MIHEGAYILAAILLIAAIAAVIAGGYRTWRIAKRMRGVQRVGEGYCPKCGYDQAGGVHQRCIECGYQFTDDEWRKLKNIEPALSKTRRETERS